MLGFNREVAVIDPEQTRYYMITLELFFQNWQMGWSLNQDVSVCSYKDSILKYLDEVGTPFPYNPVYVFPIGEPIGNGPGTTGSPEEGRLYKIQGYQGICRTGYVPD